MRGIWGRRDGFSSARRFSSPQRRTPVRHRSGSESQSGGLTPGRRFRRGRTRRVTKYAYIGPCFQVPQARPNLPLTGEVWGMRAQNLHFF